MAVDDEATGLGGRLDFPCHLADLPDPRQAIKVRHPLDEVLLLTPCAVICGADGWAGVSLLGKTRLSFQRRFLPFANGAPSHDQPGLIFGALDAAAFQKCFIAWTQGLGGAVTGVVAVDGKDAAPLLRPVEQSLCGAHGFGLEFTAQAGAGRTGGQRGVQ